MKTTIKVSISSIAFTIDEDAYQVLNTYLNALKNHFDRKPDGKEVIDDIEARLAELLSMRINLPEQVITLDDAKEVIHIMGNPSDFIDDAENNGHSPNQPIPPITIRKRLYRDADNHVIAGVCSGLGNYFALDPVIFRLLFAICAISVGVLPFLHGFGYFTIRSFAIWAYIILWIAVPQANTPQQKLEMAGKNPSIDDIEQRVRNEQKGSGDKKSDRRHSSGLISLFGTLIRIFVVLIAGCLLFAGAVALIAIVGALLGFTFHTGVGVDDILDIIGTNSWFLKTMLIIVILYPLSLLIYWGAKIIFRFKPRDKAIMVSTFIIWIIAGISLAGYAGSITWSEYSSRKEIVRTVETVNIPTPSNTLYLNLPEDYLISADEPIGELRTNETEAPRIWVNDYKGMKTLFIVPEIKVRYSSDYNEFRMEFRKKTFGRSKRSANQSADYMRFDYVQNDSILLISPLKFNKNYPLRRVREYFDIIIYAPIDKKVIIQEPLLSKSAGNGRNRWSIDFSNGIRFSDDD